MAVEVVCVCVGEVPGQGVTAAQSDGVAAMQRAWPTAMLIGREMNSRPMCLDPCSGEIPTRARWPKPLWPLAALAVSVDV